MLHPGEPPETRNRREGASAPSRQDYLDTTSMSLDQTPREDGRRRRPGERRALERPSLQGCVSRLSQTPLHRDGLTVNIRKTPQGVTHFQLKAHCHPGYNCLLAIKVCLPPKFCGSPKPQHPSDLSGDRILIEVIQLNWGH